MGINPQTLNIPKPQNLSVQGLEFNNYFITFWVCSFVLEQVSTSPAKPMKPQNASDCVKLQKKSHIFGLAASVFARPLLILTNNSGFVWLFPKSRFVEYKNAFHVISFIVSHFKMIFNTYWRFGSRLTMNRLHFVVISHVAIRFNIT